LPDSIRKVERLNKSEPLNVIFSAASGVRLGGILSALAGNSPSWRKVSTSCISVEAADVTGNGRIPQEQSWRLASRVVPCVTANALSLLGKENHARLWAQRLVSSPNTAWFATVSFEKACLVGIRPWHCIIEDGYDKGARSLVEDVCAAAKRRGWYASFRRDNRPSGVGQNGVRYSGNVYVLRVDTKPPQPALSGVTRCGA